jgi:DNA-binding NtrC family response regulator
MGQLISLSEMSDVTKANWLIRLYEDAAIHVTISEVWLPCISGFETVDQVRGADPRTGVALVRRE